MHPSQPSSSPDPVPPLTARWLALGESLVPTTLVASYRETVFEALGAEPCAMHIDVQCVVLARWHERHGVNCSAFVSACNPGSEVFTAAQNAGRHRALGDQLRRAGFRIVEGVGRHPSNGWPPEPSWLVLGITLADACDLGRQCDQNAIVWAGADAIPRLVLLR